MLSKIDSQDTRSALLRSIASVFAIVVITMGTYFSVHSFGYVDYDDPAYITKNPYVNSGLDAQNIKWAFTYKESKGPTAHDGIQNLYHPVTWLSHMLDVELFGVESPGAQHVVNLLIHLAAGILLFFIFLKLLENYVVALVTACLFCVHPLHVESVAWLSERKDTLSALFAFASILSYQYFSERPNNILKWASVLFMILALLSKPSVVILPALLILLDQYKQHKMDKWDMQFISKQFIHKLPWIIPCVVLGLVTIYTQQGGSHGYFMKDVGLWERVVHIPTRLSYYLYHVFNPTSLSFHYVRPPYASTMLSVSCLIGLIGLTVAAYRLRKQMPLFSFALLWFYICIFPMTGIVHVGTSFIADRYTYLAIIGVFACVTAAAIQYLPRQVAYFSLSLIVITCAVLAKKQTGVWKDSYSLFTNAVKAQPRDSIGYINLGTRYKLDGDLESATYYYERAIELSLNDYITYHNLAHVYMAQKQWTKAEEAFLKALDIYEYYHPTMKAISRLYRTEKEVYDLEKSLLYATRYNEVVRDRDAQMLAIEIDLLLRFKKVEEAKSKARKLQQLPNLTEEAKEFVDRVLMMN